MPKQKTKTISRQTYLKATALAWMAERAYGEGNDYYNELVALLGGDESGHLSDCTAGIRSLDKTLAVIGVKVAPAKTRKR